MVSVSSVQTLHIEHGVNSVLTPGSPLGTFHPMVLALPFSFSVLVSCVRQVIGMQKRMLVDLLFMQQPFLKCPQWARPKGGRGKQGFLRSLPGFHCQR